MSETPRVTFSCGMHAVSQTKGKAECPYCALSAAEQRASGLAAEHQAYACAGESLTDTLSRLKGAADTFEQRAEAMGGCLAGLVRIVEEVGCKDWRDEHNRRFKDTPEWVQAYNENAKRNRAGVQACRQGDRDMLATDAGKELLDKARAAIASGAGELGNG